MSAVEAVLKRPASPARVQTRYLVIDTESVPDGELIASIKYGEQRLSADEAIARAQAEAREQSHSGSDFLPVSFQVPVAVCVVRVGADYSLQAFKTLDAPLYRPDEIVRSFWKGVEDTYHQAGLVTYNGRGFDMPLLELAAFRAGIPLPRYYQNGRKRFDSRHIDLQEFFTNYGAMRLFGGLNLLAKMLGKPGKMGVAGHQVYAMHREGRLAEINDYCLCDTLDTYFVFLRSRVMTGDLAPEREKAVIARAREHLESKADETPVLKEYLANWSE